MADAEIVLPSPGVAGGDYDARAVGNSIFFQGDDWDVLICMMRDAVLCHFADGEAPEAIRVAG